jgi:hypothetical protein
MAKATRALRIAHQLESSREIKFVDTLIQVTTDWLGQLITLNTIDQGLSDTERVGDRLRLKNISIKAKLARDNAAAGTLRILVVWDKQATLSSVSDYFLDTTTNVRAMSHYNVDKQMGFTVLYDRTFVLQQYVPVKYVDLTRSLKNRLSVYNAGTNSINTGELKLLLISSISDVSLNKYNFDAAVRVKYYDD